MPKLRGADIVIKTLEHAGLTDIFTLSGNHIMSLFDATIGSSLKLFHVRHEAATVHMADAYGRLTGKPGIAWVTGGPGHANAVGALFTALGQETPMVLLSGHTETDQLGRGGFQELKQVEMAAPVAKSAWMATDTATLGMDIAKAVRIATSGRPGPVALSLPSDILDATVEEAAIMWPTPADFTAPPTPLPDASVQTILTLLAAAKRPLIIAAPVLATAKGRALLQRLEATLNIPTVISEGPRSFNDATLGAYADVAARADLVLLLGKTMDFTVKFGGAPFQPGTRFIAIDPDGAMLARAAAYKGPDLAFGCIADTIPAIEALTAGRAHANTEWFQHARACFDDRPAEWATLHGTPGKLHPAQVFQTLQPFLTQDSILIADGGEFAQWGMSLLKNDRRMINGVTGAIGASLPMAAGARAADGKNPIFAVLGDGTFGFHIAEIETAVRHNLPFIAIVGTDCKWNAEYNIQIRDYGPNRTIGCELNPTRYDQVATALGGHGELVTSVTDLAPAIERALASGKPAVINVMIDGIASPVIRR
jgi:acetolactate synthase I/II/III large subunit